MATISERTDKNNKTFQGRIVQKHDIEANWEKATNFVPLKGEIIIYDDLKKIKIGDGSTKVNELDFANLISGQNYLNMDTNQNILFQVDSEALIYYRGEQNSSGTNIDDSALTFSPLGEGFTARVRAEDMEDSSAYNFLLTGSPKYGEITRFEAGTDNMVVGINKDNSRIGDKKFEDPTNFSGLMIQQNNKDTALEDAVVLVNNTQGNESSILVKTNGIFLTANGASSLIVRENQITGLQEPAEDNQAANKKYVDDKITANTPSTTIITWSDDGT